MSLSGTFDVFSLPEVLRMLATAGKSGTLTVEGGGRAARVELFEGECCGAGPSGADITEDEPLVADHTPSVLHARLLDVAFETCRVGDGAFRFAADEHPRPRPAATTAVEPVLQELDQLQREWDDILTVVPSTDAVPVLAPILPDNEIVVSAAEWAILARLDGVAAVRDLPVRSGASLITVCRALAGLVRRGAVDLVAAPAKPVSRTPSEVLADVMLDVVPPEPVPNAAPAPPAKRSGKQTVVAEPVLAEVVAAAAESEGAASEQEGEHLESAEEVPVEGDRGAMLRMFSALRE